jgi:hypothetical protein
MNGINKIARFDSTNNLKGISAIANKTIGYLFYNFPLNLI